MIRSSSNWRKTTNEASYTNNSTSWPKLKDAPILSHHFWSECKSEHLDEKKCSHNFNANREPFFENNIIITSKVENNIFVTSKVVTACLKRKLFFKNSLKIGSQNYLFTCYLIFVLTCNFVSRRHLLLLHTGKTHDTKCNDRFCPQSHAMTEKAFEHL